MASLQKSRRLLRPEAVFSAVFTTVCERRGDQISARPPDPTWGSVSICLPEERLPIRAEVEGVLERLDDHAGVPISDGLSPSKHIRQIPVLLAHKVGSRSCSHETISKADLRRTRAVRRCVLDRRDTTRQISADRLREMSSGRSRDRGGLR